jgi:RNA polymerase sigma factor (TIGR02999 family)
LVRGEVTILLERLRGGDVAAADALYLAVYTELHARARRLLGSGAGHTLQATALVHEAWMRLDRAGTPSNDRGHFLAVAARAMRSVLVDHARAKASSRRQGSEVRILLDEALAVYEQRVPDLLELHEELERLAVLDPRLAKVVELRFFGGLSIAEVAEVLELGHATVERDWQAARAYLASRLAPDSRRTDDGP